MPGHVHLDLLIAGVAQDPFEREGEAGCQWIGEESWEYRCEFDWQPKPDGQRRVLRFGGLDTVAEVFLNGESIARHDNMFVPLEFDVSDRLLSGSNELRVHFESAVKVGMERRRAYFEAESIPHGTNWFDERAFVRKAAYMSGWDWGPRLVSCGIWQPVSLLEFDARIVSFTVFQEPAGSGFRVWSETRIEGDTTFETNFDGQVFTGDFDIKVEEPELWWPNGEGVAHLYQAHARLPNGHTIEKPVGLRTIRLCREPDDLGESFEFVVNGRRIFARGANWIPNDSFPSAISEEDYRSQIETCVALNMNMIRVWGGGLYESEAFYDACDELGILVWQDFPNACSYYPDGPDHRAEAAREADHHLRRLRGRTCLALWCGNNENDVMWQGKWGGEELSPPRYHGDSLYGETYAQSCAALDPNRPYIRSSPIGRHESNLAWGDEHYWDVWHGRGDWQHYAESVTRFSSEFGFASACGATCWLSAGIAPTESTPDDSPVRWHDKTNKPWDVFREMVELHYPPSETLDEWIYRSQLNQRDALRFGIEHYRTNPYCRGTLIWQFNDCWPVQSWAVQDYARELKIAGFEMRRLYASVLVSLRLEGQAMIVAVANDGPESFAGEIEVEMLDVAGDSIRKERHACRLAPSERNELARIDLTGLNRNRTVARAQIAGEPDSETWRTLAEPKEMEWQMPSMVLEGSSLLVQGLAYDLVLDDPISGATIGFADSTGTGMEAKTIVNGSTGLRLDGSEAAIRARTLAGGVLLKE